MADPEFRDPFQRSKYGSLISWSDRIEREWPFLRDRLRSAPSNELVDLGCGSGEHAVFLQGQGLQVTGIDPSSAQIEAARTHAGEEGPRFLQGGMAELPRLTRTRFGSALCLGNVLPYLDHEDLERAMAGVRAGLLPGAPWLIQLVNYPGLQKRGVRTLPVNVRPGDGPEEETVFLRILRWAEAGYVDFFPASLRLCAQDDFPLQVEWTRRVRLRCYQLADLQERLDRHGFEVQQSFGGMRMEPFDATESHDIVLVATRR